MTHGCAQATAAIVGRAVRTLAALVVGEEPGLELPSYLGPSAVKINATAALLRICSVRSRCFLGLLHCVQVLRSRLLTLFSLKQEPNSEPAWDGVGVEAILRRAEAACAAHAGSPALQAAFVEVVDALSGVESLGHIEPSQAYRAYLSRLRA